MYMGWEKSVSQKKKNYYHLLFNEKQKEVSQNQKHCVKNYSPWQGQTQEKADNWQVHSLLTVIVQTIMMKFLKS